MHWPTYNAHVLYKLSHALIKWCTPSETPKLSCMPTVITASVLECCTTWCSYAWWQAWLVSNPAFHGQLPMQCTSSSECSSCFLIIPKSVKVSNYKYCIILASLLTTATVHGFNSYVYVAIVQLQWSTSLMGSYIILFSTDQLAT